MPDSPRERFLKRLSTVGTGLRQDIQLTLGVIVADLRDLVIRGALPDDDVDAAVALHDRVEAVWQATLRTDPPLSPDQLVARLSDLKAWCTGPVAGFGLRLDVVLEKAAALRDSRKHR
ncbi:MAG TPA: hypothetical protein VFH97_05665 [Gemmatimonadales bacterium]|nr:hypothetical protein [Gemmatimonadales bacterium]